MKYLRDQRIDGNSDYVAEVHRLFGDLYFGDHVPGNSAPFAFTVRRFRNIYRDSTGQTPLYCLAPNQRIDALWFDSIPNVVYVRYGTSSKKGSCRFVTRVICVQLTNKVGLLVCLSADGHLLEDEDNFGI